MSSAARALRLSDAADGNTPTGGTPDATKGDGTQGTPGTPADAAHVSQQAQLKELSEQLIAMQAAQREQLLQAQRDSVAEIQKFKDQMALQQAAHDAQLAHARKQGSPVTALGRHALAWLVWMVAGTLGHILCGTAWCLHTTAAGLTWASTRVTAASVMFFLLATPERTYGACAYPLSAEQIAVLDRMRVLSDNGASGNITNSLHGLIKGTERQPFTDAFSQGTGDMTCQFMADFRRDIKGPVGPRVRTLMPWHFCKDSTVEVMSEPFLKRAMLCALFDPPGSGGRVVEFHEGTSVTLNEGRNGLGTAYYVQPDDGLPIASLCHARDAPALHPLSLAMPHVRPARDGGAGGDNATNGSCHVCTDAEAVTAEMLAVEEWAQLTFGDCATAFLGVHFSAARVHMGPLKLTSAQWVRLLHYRGGHQALTRQIKTIADGTNDFGVELTPALKAAFADFASHGCDICAAVRRKARARNELVHPKRRCGGECVG
jgi:hypothetical protein